MLFLHVLSLHVLARSAHGRRSLLDALGNLLHAAVVDMDRKGRDPRGGDAEGGIQRFLPVIWRASCVELWTLSRLLAGASEEAGG